jgi:alpha-glucosidase
MLENLGLSGFAFSGADVGGYAGTPTQDLLTKWFEVAAFQPIDRNHTEKDTGDQEPWVGGPDQESIRRHFIETRYQLMPYLYTLAEEATQSGLPILRPLFLEFPDAATDHRPIDTDPAAASEFLLGPDLLIAPPQYGDELDAYTVEFPSSDWFNFWTGEKITFPATVATPDPTSVPAPPPLPSIQVSPELAQLPVFVHAGSILPMAPVVQSTNETPQGALTLRVYVGDHCAGDLYQDDGKTYAYQHGAYLRMKFSCEQTSEGLRLNISPHEGSYPAWWKEIRAEIYGWTPKSGDLLVNGKPIAEHASLQAQEVQFVIADDGKGMTVELK